MKSKPPRHKVRLARPLVMPGGRVVDTLKLRPATVKDVVALGPCEATLSAATLARLLALLSGVSAEVIQSQMTQADLEAALVVINTKCMPPALRQAEEIERICHGCR